MTTIAERAHRAAADALVRPYDAEAVIAAAIREAVNAALERAIALCDTEYQRSFNCSKPDDAYGGIGFAGRQVAALDLKASIIALKEPG